MPKKNQPQLEENRIVLSLGSNLGNKAENLSNAIVEISKLFEIDRTSKVIETEAILLADSPKEWDLPYLNQVISGIYNGDILALLKRLQDIEVMMGRDKDHPKWAPRIIDIDILFWGNKIIDLPNLKIPHPEFKNRKFLNNLI